MSRKRSQEKIQTSDFVSIGELVSLTGARYSTLKYYTEEGMIPFEQEGQNLTRRYKRETTVDRIYYIKSLRDQNWTIPDIKKHLKALDEK